MPIDVETRPDGITFVTLSNPARRNALDEAMFRSLAALWPELARSSTRCVVLRGADGAFCSGADLSADLAGLADIDDLIDGALLKSRFFPKPVIAAIDGPCVAGGFELALNCDLRLCSDRSRFGLPEARWGVYPAGGGATRLAGQIGHARAADLLLSGRLFDAGEALDIGFVSAVVPAAELMRSATDAAGAIAANSPAVVLAIKRYLHAAATVPPRLARLDRDLAAMTRESADAAEGRAAFLEKRRPQYGTDGSPDTGLACMRS